MGEPSRSTQLCDADSHALSTSPSASLKTSAPQRFILQTSSGTHPSTIKGGSFPMVTPPSSQSSGVIPPRSLSCPPLDRRFSKWLGRSHGKLQCLGDLVPRRKHSSYQHLGGTGGSIQRETTRPFSPPSPLVHRQCPSSVRSQQTFLQIICSPARDHSAHSSPNREEPENQSISHFLPSQHEGGRAQSLQSSSLGMGASPRSFPTAHSPSRSIGDRLDGHESQYQTPSLPLTPPGPSSSGMQCPRVGLEPMVPNLSVSAEMANPHSDDQASNLQEPRPSHSPLVSSGAMVPVHPQQDHPPVAPISAGSNERWTARLREVDRLQFLKEVFASKLGETVALRLTSAYRESTTRQAQSVWKAFKKWLPAEVTTITSQVMMEFLIACEDERQLEPRTILNYRSQLALPIIHAFGIDLSSDTFSLLARSQFLRNPPSKQKIPQWSIDRALETFSSQPFATPTATLHNLFLKTLFLTALASGNRVSELAAITRTGLLISNDKVILPTKPGFLFKNQTARHPLPPDITFPSLGRAHTLCPATALRCYIAKTENLPHNDSLFVHPTSGKPLVAGRLSYWLANAIKTGDPNAIRPAGHDIRKCGHSIAHFRQVDPADILRQGFWHSPHVFIHRYLISCRPSASNFVAGRIIV